MKLFLSGYGRMGHMVESLALERGWEIVGRADVTTPEVYGTAPKADVCIDFSGRLYPPDENAPSERHDGLHRSGFCRVTRIINPRPRDLDGKLQHRHRGPEAHGA